MEFSTLIKCSLDSLFLQISILCLTTLILFKIMFRSTSRSQPGILTSKSQPQSPPIFHTSDRLFGIDFLLRNMRLVQQGRIMQQVILDHRKYGSTFRVLSQMRDMLYTIDPSNLKAIYENSAQEWGAEPHRLRALGPLCGAGHITADGEQLLRSDEMLGPFLRKHTGTATTPGLASRMNAVFEQIPRNGQTFNVAPLVDKLASLHSTPFLRMHQPLTCQVSRLRPCLPIW